MDSCIRQLRFNRSYSTNIQKSVRPVNKKQKIISITSVEDLPNEIFYEIFEHLDGCHIYEVFLNLNNRFNELLNSSSLLFKIQVHSLCEESYMDIYKQLILTQIDHYELRKRLNTTVSGKNTTIYDYLRSRLNTNEFLPSYSIDSLFTRLESLALRNIEPTILTSIQSNLTGLSRLFSLTVDTYHTSNNLSEVYRLIFMLPKLKYVKYSADGCATVISLPFATNEQSSSIEYFRIDHFCIINQLCTLTSYTPQVCHLKVSELFENDPINEIILRISLINLTYISIGQCTITFDKFEMFIKQTECNLEVLRIITYIYDINYFDNNRWEQLISGCLPKLKEFYLEYFQDIDPESGCSIDYEPSQRFTSLFWIKRKWVFELEMSSSNITYKISSYKKRWYNINSSIKLSKPTRLTITDYDKDMEMLDLTIRDILAATQIYHLEISENISSDLLLNLIFKLSVIDSLKISSLTLSYSDEQNIRVVSNKNVITKVYLENINGIEEVYFLMRLCPRMKYLKVNLINEINYELYLKNILTKIKQNSNKYLRSLCLYNPTADNKMVEKLQKMINQKKLLCQYTIKCEHNNIYLKWK
ncbi:unnamed protein product [Adineta steineri]|uniref:F-box domain-containing protein n=1 Tax=Adineta steineri TaxID=433720 RepID=A0A813XJG5_9BILA|nr:unnamed protein product [Adineta steineri]